MTEEEAEGYRRRLTYALNQLSKEDARAEGAITTEECCADWTPQASKINGFIVLQAVRRGNLKLYDGIPFRFCPWCGKKRALQAEEEKGAY